LISKLVIGWDWCAKLGFFTTELTEEDRRATEYCNFLEERHRAIHGLKRQAQFPQEVAVLRGPQPFSVCSVVEKASYVNEP
jgi:hypothetical protein